MGIYNIAVYSTMQRKKKQQIKLKVFSLYRGVGARGLGGGGCSSAPQLIIIQIGGGGAEPPPIFDVQYYPMTH